MHVDISIIQMVEVNDRDITALVQIANILLGIGCHVFNPEQSLLAVSRRGWHGAESIY